MNCNSHPLYLEDVASVCGAGLPWERLDGASVLVSGATGLLGSFLVDVLMRRGCRVTALGRSESKARERFAEYLDGPLFRFVPHDINNPLPQDIETPDYVIHLASNTHPVAYATDPVGTVTTNIIGTRNMLEAARRNPSARFVFASSNEVYGENRGDVELFDEKYCGYIDCNTLRAGYPESKRCGEALCQAYIRQCGVDAVIPRFTRSYGPTLLGSDTKALSQFLSNALAGKDIVLKSSGTQHYSFTYMADAICGMLYVMLLGGIGLAYNIADRASDITLADLARLIASKCGTEVVFDLPSEAESTGFSKATKARLDSTRLQSLGWRAMYDISSGIDRTLSVLKNDLGNQ